MNDHRRSVRRSLFVAALGLALGIGAAGATAAASSGTDPVEVPATDEPPSTEPPTTEPPATEPATTEPAAPADAASDDDTNWDAYVVAGVLGFTFLVVLAAWVMVNRRDDDAGPQAEPPTSI